MATIRARYEKGVLTPLEPLDLEEGREVKLDVTLEELPQGSVSDDDKATPDPVTDDDATLSVPLQVALDADEPPPNVNPTLWWIANLHKKYPPGAFDDVPTDMSINVDHYAYGLPKRTEEDTIGDE